MHNHGSIPRAGSLHFPAMRPMFLLMMGRFPMIVLSGLVLAGGSPHLRAASRAKEQTITLDSFPSSGPLHFFDQIDALDMRAWRYSSVGQIEILTRCPDETTKRFVRELRIRLQMMKAIRPELPAVSLDRPLRLFLYTKNGPWEQQENRIVAGTSDSVTLLVNLVNYELSPDGTAKDASMLQATGVAAQQFVLTQLWQFRSTAQTTEKPVPLWLWFALLPFYWDVRFTSDAVGVAWPPTGTDTGLKETLVGESWRTVALLPMGKIFDQPDQEQAGVRSLQLGLFVRWALLAEHQKHRDAFWKFASRAIAAPVTEAVFKECFGTTYAQVQAELTGDLAPGRATVAFPPITRAAFSWPSLLSFDDASAEEIARFKAAVDDVIDRQPRL